jgi:hypothetical protein
LVVAVSQQRLLPQCFGSSRTQLATPGEPGLLMVQVPFIFPP